MYKKDEIHSFGIRMVKKSKAGSKEDIYYWVEIGQGHEMFKEFMNVIKYPIPALVSWKGRKEHRHILYKHPDWRSDIYQCVCGFKTKNEAEFQKHLLN